MMLEIGKRWIHLVIDLMLHVIKMSDGEDGRNLGFGEERFEKSHPIFKLLLIIRLMWSSVVVVVVEYVG